MEEKLLLATRKKLERNGTLGHLRSEFENEILNLLGLVNGLKKDERQPITTRRNIADEIVADYLDWIGYSFTSAIFNSESCVGTSERKVDRKALIEELGLGEFADESLKKMLEETDRFDLSYDEAKIVIMENLSFLENEFDLAAILAWVSKLEEPVSCMTAKAVRNEYARLLAHQLLRQTLQYPFTEEPPQGALQPITISSAGPSGTCPAKCPKPLEGAIPCVRGKSPPRVEEANLSRYTEWPFDESEVVVGRKPKCRAKTSTCSSGKPCPSAAQSRQSVCFVPDQPQPIPSGYLQETGESDERPFAPSFHCTEENQARLTRLAASVTSKTELFEFMNEIAPFTCDLGETMQAVVSEELAQFKEFVRTVYKSRALDTQLLLTREHDKLKARYEEWESNVLRRAKGALAALKLTLPNFNFATYKREPDYLYQMLRDQLDLEGSDNSPKERLLRAKAQKKTFLNEESQRIEKDNMDRMLELRELNAQLSALSNSYNSIHHTLSEKGKLLEDIAAQHRIRHDENQKQIDELIDRLNTLPKNY